MFSFRNKKVLIIAPHPDDEVIGCGGFISKARRSGAAVYVLYLTVGDTVGFTKKGVSTMRERVAELRRAAKFLRLNDYRIAFPDNNHHLRLDTIAQKEIIGEIEKGKGISLESIKPDIVLTPNPNDYNQDHRAAALATITACRPNQNSLKHTPAIVLFYEYPVSDWAESETKSAPNCFIVLSPADLRAKLKALNLYQSQLKPFPHFISAAALEFQAHLRGVLAGAKQAEAFFLKRLII